MINNDVFSLSIVGDGSTGKSSIINAFKSDGFASNYKQTIGIDFFEKKMVIQGHQISMRVWDVGGQSIHSKNLNKYVGSSDIIFLNYDVTNKDSFYNLEDWLNKIKKYCQKNSHKIYLVGNKIDLISQRQVQETEHHQFMSDHQLHGSFFTSAKTGENIVKSFYQAAAESKGLKLSPNELNTYDKVIQAHIIIEGDKSSNDNKEIEGRTAYADEIEREDMEAERRKNKKLCVIC